MVRILVLRPGIPGWVGSMLLETVVEAAVPKLEVTAETSAALGKHYFSTIGVVGIHKRWVRQEAFVGTNCLFQV